MPDPNDLPVSAPAAETPPAAPALPDTPDLAAPSTAAAGADDGHDTAEPAPGPAAALPQLTPAAAADLLRQHFPALFAGPAKPFKLRIQQDIQARAPGVFSKGTLSAYFRRHTGSTGYLIALTKASHRFDLDGQPAGELSEEHKQLAQAELTRRRQLTREREQQSQTQQREQQREAQRAEMAQQAEAMQARQERAALLRDFQRTTLTLANFCALKGTTPDALNPVLAQARQEAAEAPPLTARHADDRRGPRRDDRPGQRGDGPAKHGAPGARPDNRGPRRDDRRPARPGAAPAPRGPRGPAGQS
jgi:ProP effector